MKNNIHPVSSPTVFTCANCEAQYETESTRQDHAKLDVCSNCHPAYTGKVTIDVSGSRIDAFNSRYKQA